MSTSRTINHQARYDKLFREFSDLERQADAQDQFLRLLLRRVFFAVDRAYPQLSSECTSIRSVLHQAEDGFLPLDRLRPLTEQLAERIRQIEANEETPEPAAGGRETAGDLSVRRALDLLLERIDFSDTLQERKTELRQVLQAGNKSFPDSVLIDRTAALINDMHSMVEQEKTDLVGFLQQTTSKLAAIDQYALMGLDLIQEDRDAQIQLNQAAKQHIRDVSATVTASDNLEMLKQSVQQSLVQIGDNFDRLRAKEEQQLQRAEQEIHMMQQHIAQLQGETKRLHGQLKATVHHILHDDLTGLPSELAMTRRLQQEIAGNRRPIWLAHWDIDDFREINARCGRQIADKMLYIVGKNLKRLTQRDAMAARLRGEDFLILLTGVDAKTAHSRIEAMRKHIAATSFRFKGDTIRITVSCGLAEHRPGETVDSLLQRAEQALDQSKRRGTDQCTVS